MKDILDKWNNYLLLECGPLTTTLLDEGSKKSHYQDSPIEPDGKSTKRKKRERFNKRKSKVTFGMTEPFSRGELDLLRSTSISNLAEEAEEDCLKGNGVHKQDDGKFGKPEDIGSWSKGYHSPKKDCKKGKLRKPSSSKASTWTKADKCGRDGPYLCGTKDTLKWNSPNLKNEVYRVLQEIFTEFDNYDHAVSEGQQGNITAETCRRMGFKTFQQFLQSIDAIKRAEQGKLNPEKD